MLLNIQDKIPHLFILLLFIVSNLCRLNMLGQYISSASSLIHTPLVWARFIQIDSNTVRLLTTVKLGSIRTARHVQMRHQGPNVQPKISKHVYESYLFHEF